MNHSVGGELPNNGNDSRVVTSSSTVDRPRFRWQYQSTLSITWCPSGYAYNFCIVYFISIDLRMHTFFTWRMSYKSVWRSKMRKVSMLYGIMEVMKTQRIANMTYLALLRTIDVDCTAVRSWAGNLYKFSVRFTVGTNLITSEAPTNIELGKFMKNLFKLRCKGFSYGRITEAWYSAVSQNCTREETVYRHLCI